MAKTFLQSLATGLRIAGSTTSDQNFRAFNIQNEGTANRDNQNKQLMLGLLVKGAENGVPGAEEALMKFSKENYGQGANVGEGVPLQKLRAEQAATEEAAQRRQSYPEQLRALEQRIMGAATSGKQSSPLDTPREDFSNSISPESSTEVPVVDIDGRGTIPPKESPTKLRELADAVDDFALAMPSDDKDIASRVTNQANVMRKEAERLEALAAEELPGKLSASAEKVKRVQEITGDTTEGRALAIKIVDGGFRILQDAQGRDYLYDIIENKRVSNLDPILMTEIRNQQEDRKALDFEASTGFSGHIKRWANALVGLFGNELMFPDAQEATNVLQQMQNDTLALAVGKIPGRPSNFRLQLTNRLTVDPKAILQGDAAALQKLRNTRDYLKKEATRMKEVVIDNPRAYTSAQLNETANNRYLMNDIVNQYEWAIDSMARKGKPRKSAKEIYEAN